MICNAYSFWMYGCLIVDLVLRSQIIIIFPFIFFVHFSRKIWAFKPYRKKSPKCVRKREEGSGVRIEKGKNVADHVIEKP